MHFPTETGNEIRRSLLTPYSSLYPKFYLRLKRADGDRTDPSASCSKSRPEGWPGLRFHSPCPILHIRDH